MLTPFKDLLIYKRKNLYDVAKHRKDSKFNNGFDYKDKMFGLMLSKHIQRNQTIRDFILFLNDYFYNVISGVKYLKLYKNYTIENNITNTMKRNNVSNNSETNSNQSSGSISY